MERETGIEPATFSLGNRPSTENNEHSVSGIMVEVPAAAVMAAQLQLVRALADAATFPASMPASRGFA